MKKIILGMAACAALCACTSDDLLVDNSTAGEVTDGVYMKFKLNMSSTRSTTGEPEDGYVTSSEGIEEGTDAENTVKKVLIVLTTPDGKFITAAKEYSGSGDTYYVATFEASDIEAYTGQEVDVLVGCNLPDGVSGKDTEAYYTLTGATDGTPWKDNQFFMSNAKKVEVKVADDLTPYKDINTPYDIGEVDVERSMARFDYKDGSETNDFTYPMMADDVNGVQINVVLKEMALVNMSNSFYYLRHMAASTNENNDVADLSTVADYLLAAETPTDWVIDTDAEDKINYAGEDLSTHFTYPLQYPSQWQWDDMASICTTDNKDNWQDQSYHPWRYATENTVPSIEAQQNGITTGVVFKGQIVPTETCDEDLKEAFESGERIFAFANEIVGTWDMVKAYASVVENYETALAAAYREVMDQLGDSYNKLQLSNAQAAAGFTGYSPDPTDGNYYAYYYYWNRHNDNKQSGVMGIMEFDVVRNNVYKLSVTGINLLGHPMPSNPDDPEDPNYNPDGPDDPDDPDNPDDPDPDPDPVNPDTPNEEDNIYIQVEVRILPWVVRENSITF